MHTRIWYRPAHDDAVLALQQKVAGRERWCEHEFREMPGDRIDAFLATSCGVAGFTSGSWREWLADVLATLLNECEGFSGKRPNCDSHWPMWWEDSLVVAGLKDDAKTQREIVCRAMSLPDSLS